MLTRKERLNESGKLFVPLGGLIGRTTDNERSARFIDKDGVDFIDNSVVMSTLHAIIQSPRHVVAQVIETKFVVGAVSNVAVIRFTSLSRSHRTKDDAYGKTEKAVDTSHPFTITFGQVIIDRDDVDTFT
ncbi:unannotated protein [freshwater metagenome]|uniref:Unannotated protein n=1 Tax=freshwater metagenome TaxID=449393 RepID=A0A6J7FI28_9ZZZZ